MFLSINVRRFNSFGSLRIVSWNPKIRSNRQALATGLEMQNDVLAHTRGVYNGAFQRLVSGLSMAKRRSLAG
jgi:hypothetical protein